MNKFDYALKEICSLEREATQNKYPCNINPVVKLFTTLIYIGIIMAIPNEEIVKLLSYLFYPFVMFFAFRIPFKSALKRIWFALGGVFLLGIGNFIFAKNLEIGLLAMTGLWLKGVFCVLGVYLLAVTTKIEDLCTKLYEIGFPESFVTVFLLVYRYINVLIKETKRLWEAYEIGSAGQKGIAFRYWGPFLGQLLLRSMDRAQTVYDSMNVRGYRWGLRQRKRRIQIRLLDVLWFFFWNGVFFLFLYTDIFTVLGEWIWKIF